MSLSVPLSAEIEVLRAKIRDNTITAEEMHAVISKLRSGRMMAADTAKKSPSRVKAPSGDELLNDLI